MKGTITDSGGLYWLQHSPPKSLLRTAIGAHRTLREHLRDALEAFKSFFTRLHSLGESKSRLVVGSVDARFVSPCLQRVTGRSRRLVVLAR